jgi:hypothetical protein
MEGTLLNEAKYLDCYTVMCYELRHRAIKPVKEAGFSG